MRTLLKISTVLLLFLTASCMFDGIRGNRNVATQDRNISSDFDAIKVSHGIDVQLTMGNSTSLTVEADENLHDIIMTEVENGVLRIYAEKNIWRSKKRKVYVTAEELSEIRTTSGANVRTENTITAEDFKVSSTSGSDVRLSLDVQDLSCSTTSGANAYLSGTAQKFVANSTSGSNIRAKDLKAKICEARVTSGADIAVHAIEELHASATSGGNIRCSGNPEIVKKNSSSGGSIRS